MTFEEAVKNEDKYNLYQDCYKYYDDKWIYICNIQVSTYISYFLDG
jgi:hypothetical protein